MVFAFVIFGVWAIIWVTIWSCRFIIFAVSTIWELGEWIYERCRQRPDDTEPVEYWDYPYTSGEDR